MHDSAGNLTITGGTGEGIGFSDGSQLTIANYGSSSVNQFQLMDGTYTYSTETKKFTKNA